MKIRKKIAFGTLLAAVLLIAVVLVPSMGASPSANQTKSKKHLGAYIAKARDTKGTA